MIARSTVGAVGKKERDRGEERERERERNTHADGHRWTDRHRKLGRGDVLHRETAKEVAEKVTEALL